MSVGVGPDVGVTMVGEGLLELEEAMVELVAMLIGIVVSDAALEAEVTEPVKEVKLEDTEAAAEPSAAVAEASAEAIWRRSNGCSSGLASTSNAATSTWNVGEKCIAA